MFISIIIVIIITHARTHSLGTARTHSLTRERTHASSHTLAHTHTRRKLYGHGIFSFVKINRHLGRQKEMANGGHVKIGYLTPLSLMKPTAGSRTE